MFISGPALPTDAQDGSGGNHWTDVSNVTMDNTTFAYCPLPGGGDVTNPIVCTQFGFNIPDIATIDGIVVNVRGSGASTQDNAIRLIVNSTPSGDIKNGNVWTLSPSDILHGGSSDSWGLELTPTDVNDVAFGVQVQAENISGGTTVYVTKIEMTVYWHYEFNDGEEDVPTRYEFHVTTRSGDYLGSLDNVIAPENIPMEINTVGSQLTLEVKASADRAMLPVEYIVTEDGENVTDENGEYLVTENAGQIVALGSTIDTNAIIKNGNRISWHEFNRYYPNGHVIFTGQIVKIKASFSDSDSVFIKLNSDGMDTDHYIARDAVSTYVEELSQDSSNGAVTILLGSTGNYVKMGQSFLLDNSVLNIAGITVRLLGSASVNLGLYDAANGTLVASSSRYVDTGGTPSEVLFTFALPYVIVGDRDLFFDVVPDVGQKIVIYYNSGSPYPDGAMYEASYFGGSGGGSYIANASYDLYFKVYSGDKTTYADFNSKDPTTEMLEPLIEDYNNRGGSLQIGDIEATGLSLSYEYNTNTILEAIKATLRMCPNTFYYFADPGSNVFDMKQVSTSPDYRLTRGRHIASLNFGLSIEDVVNHVLFTGGDTGSGFNLYKEYEDATSRQLYGERLYRHTDNRVTVNTTASAMGQRDLSGSGEQYEVDVFIPHGTMDTWLLKPGKTVIIDGYSTFFSSLILQIVRAEYSSKGMRVILGTLPQKLLPAVEFAVRGLVAQQTIANPTEPS